MSDRETISNKFDEYVDDVVGAGGLISSCDYESFEAGWQAARAQGGQGVELVGYTSKWCLEHAGVGIRNSLASLYAKPEGEINIPLYAHPQPAQQGSVPEEVMERVKNLLCSLGHQGCVLDEWEPPYDIGEWGIKEAQELHSILTTPQPEGDGWVKCSERLPTEADEDICGQVWGWVETKGVGKWFRMSATETRDMSGNRAGPICTLWMPTGLKRPQPPTQEGKGDE